MPSTLPTGRVAGRIASGVPGGVTGRGRGLLVLVHVDLAEERIDVVALGIERTPDLVGLAEAVARALVGDKVVRAVVLLAVVLRVVVEDVDDLAAGDSRVHELALGVRARLPRVTTPQSLVWHFMTPLVH